MIACHKRLTLYCFDDTIMLSLSEVNVNKWIYILMSTLIESFASAPQAFQRCLGERLTELMNARGWDTKALNLMTGISPSLINAIKRGEGNPTLTTLSTLANCFSVSIDTLISEKGLDQKECVKKLAIYHQEDAHQRQQHSPLAVVNLPTSFPENDMLFGVLLKNSSLSPFFEKESLFVLHPSKSYADGDLVLVRLKHEHNVFRKVFLGEDSCIFQTISLSAELQKFTHYHILGTVTKVIYEFS